MRRLLSFVHLYNIFRLYLALQKWSSKSSNFLVFDTFGGISSRLAAFLFSIFLITSLSSSRVNWLSLMSRWQLTVFVICLFVILGEFLKRFLKFSFPIYICSSLLAAFSFALEEFFFIAHFIYCLPWDYSENAKEPYLRLPNKHYLKVILCHILFKNRQLQLHILSKEKINLYISKITITQNSQN